MSETSNIGNNLNPKLKPLHPTNDNKTMNTTHTMNPGVAISLAQTSNPTAPADTARPRTPVAASRKTVTLGLLALAGGAAGMLCFKAAVVISYLMTALDNLYNSMST